MRSLNSPTGIYQLTCRPHPVPVSTLTSAQPMPRCRWHGLRGARGLAITDIDALVAQHVTGRACTRPRICVGSLPAVTIAETARNVQPTLSSKAAIATTACGARFSAFAEAPGPVLVVGAQD
jgi:hypothetical protein